MIEVSPLIIAAAIIIILTLVFVVTYQHATICSLRHNNNFLRARDAQWRDPSQPRPLPIGER
jgi:hypothetical protein